MSNRDVNKLIFNPMYTNTNRSIQNFENWTNRKPNKQTKKQKISSSFIEFFRFDFEN